MMPAPACCIPLCAVPPQVKVHGSNGRVSASPRLPVALRCAPLTDAHQRCWVGAVMGGPPLSVGLTWAEWLGSAVNWPVLVHR